MKTIHVFLVILVIAAVYYLTVKKTAAINSEGSERDGNAIDKKRALELEWLIRWVSASKTDSLESKQFSINALNKMDYDEIHSVFVYVSKFVMVKRKPDPVADAELLADMKMIGEKYKVFNW